MLIENVERIDLRSDRSIDFDQEKVDDSRLQNQGNSNQENTVDADSDILNMRIDHYEDLKEKCGIPLSPKSKLDVKNQLITKGNNLLVYSEVRSIDVLAYLNDQSCCEEGSQIDTSNQANFSQENSFLEFNSNSTKMHSFGCQSLATS